MKELKGRVALVTGAASGIGRETALLLARQGMQLALCDVNAQGLETIRQEVEGISSCLLAHPVNVADRDAMASFADAVHERAPAVDVLVNNAGVGLAGDALSMELEDWDWILSTNLYGVIHGCHFFIPPMAARGAGGHVVNVSSMLGYFPSPKMAGYSAAKFGVLGMSQCMRMDLQPHGIGVSAICPGMIKTGIVRASRIRGRNDPDATREKADRLYQRRSYGPERVAAAILKAIQRNRAVLPVSPEAWFSHYMVRLAPGISAAIAGWLDRQMID